MQNISIIKFDDILSFIFIPTYIVVAFLGRKIYKTTSDECCTCRATNEIEHNEYIFQI